jgi:hypothetical protein
MRCFIRGMRRVEHVARKDKKNIYKIFVGEVKGKYHLEDLGVYGRTILRRILQKQDVTMLTFLNR